VSSGDLAAVVVTVCVVVALVALIAVLTQAFALMRELRRKLEDFDAKVGPALSQLADTAEMAQTEISRLRDLLNVAQKVAGLAESAGAATARAAAAPVDKVRSAISVLRGAQTGSTAQRGRDADARRETASGSESRGR
jgi:predicted PurR-regulated permease PerM